MKSGSKARGWRLITSGVLLLLSIPVLVLVLVFLTTAFEVANVDNAVLLTILWLLVTLGPFITGLIQIGRGIMRVRSPGSFEYVDHNYPRDINHVVPSPGSDPIAAEAYSLGGGSDAALRNSRGNVRSRVETALLVVAVVAGISAMFWFAIAFFGATGMVTSWSSPRGDEYVVVGTVVGTAWQEPMSSAHDGERRAPLCSEIVEYTVDGRTAQIEGSYLRSPCDVVEGNAAEVIINPTHANRTRVVGGGTGAFLTVIMAVGGIGLVSAGVCGGCIWGYRHQRRKGVRNDVGKPNPAPPHAHLPGSVPPPSATSHGAVPHYGAVPPYGAQPPPMTRAMYHGTVKERRRRAEADHSS